MDNHNIALVQATFHAVAPMADEFSAAFYAHLFELDPSLRSMFPSDLTGQRRKLVDELAAIVDTIGRLPVLVARTTELGRRHVDYGVEPHHYDLVLDALMHAFGVCIPERMTPEVVVSWRRAYNLVAETMLYGAAHGTAHA
ncbi:MAG: Hemoglobin-like protein [Ilumatobacteraceae bacterium]|nr:Hemoglobin-like protein [Ilumatobacteraceae bacterium]MCU1390019.1 Hemoglobin-like protein [Ilumatobacteraceae bacterium]